MCVGATMALVFTVNCCLRCVMMTAIIVVAVNLSTASTCNFSADDYFEC